jgi:glycosyltransferase involved in cell wall biosynthesis
MNVVLQHPDSAARHLGVSIVINNFNYGRFLGDAIDSALTQTSPADEVIVVDDGSTDDSPDIIRIYGDAIRPVLKRNGGQTSAFNVGFAHTHCDIICFLDADDVLESTALFSIRTAFANPHVVKTHWPLAVIGSDGRRTGKMKPPHRLQQGALLSRLFEVGPDDPSWVPTSGNAWRRAFLAEIFPLPEPERGAGIGSASADACMSMLAPLFGEVARIDEPQGRYRLHGSNDHSCMQFEKRLNRDVALFEQRATLLASYCERHGISIDPNLWRKNAWCHKLQRALEAIDKVIPQESPFLLVDDLTWELPPSQKPLALPFVESAGQYAGPPLDSDEAISQLERMRQAGAEYIAITWPSFWWLDHYRGFSQYLHAEYRRLVSTDDIIIFALCPVANTTQTQSMGELLSVESL